MRLHPLLVSVLLFACSANQHGPSAPAAEKAEGRVNAPEVSAEPAAPAAPPQTAAQAPASPRCGADADCVAVDHYCESCRCLPLAASAPRPKCDGAAVQCFVAPCRGKHAICRDGACALDDSNEAM